MKDTTRLQACSITVSGRVQGVGFRPFVYRLAHDLGVLGQVCNVSGEVEITAEASPSALYRFRKDLIDLAPPLSRPSIKHIRPMEPGNFRDFRIAASEDSGEQDLHLPPDQFACDDCLAEMNDPGRHRYQYPFINCTQCGPRYTIIKRLPYDRPNTTMSGFPLCPACQEEYENPLDRRFHAQPLACPDCGPTLTYLAKDGDGGEISGNKEALAACIRDLGQGRVVAARGIGGYHLLCDATNEGTVATLRERKNRPAKPLAIMIPWTRSAGEESIRRFANPSDLQLASLTGPMRPIVLVPSRSKRLAASVAPGLDEIGLMLPYSPLHHMLLDAFDGPLVATSGNFSGEPVITDREEAESRLATVASGYLQHNRPIQRPADDPVFREICGRVRPVRIGRGNAPLEMQLPFRLTHPVIATGAFLKNTIALAWDRRAVISPHIGDLGSRRSREIFGQVVEDLQSLYGVRAEHIATDAHPDYPNARWASQQTTPMTRVFHHHAHASALFGECGVTHPMLVFTWDGLGYGEDGTAWGGEALLGMPGAWKRVISFRSFRLPGGDKVVFEPWRTALSMTWEANIEWPDAPEFPPLLKKAWENGINAPPGSAVGRIFDAAAVFTRLLTVTSYDGEAPARLEALCEPGHPHPIEMPINPDAESLYRVDWAPLVEYLITSGETPQRKATVFHDSLAWSLCSQAKLICHEHNVHDIGLAGGVFQNKRLTERAAVLLNNAGLTVHIPEQLPVNDAAISFGQIIEAGAQANAGD